MIKKIKKPVSILLSLIMVFSLFTIVPFSASAAVGDVLSESEYLTFTAVEAGSSVTLKYANGTLKYNINNSGWQSYTAGTQITLADVGDYVRFSGKDTTFDYSNHFSLTGKVACSGNVMSLRLDDNGRDQGLTDRCFQYMFYNCIGLTTAPELPETTLADRCYYGMFQGCENLTKAPDLPATALANNCYGYMFSGCKSLTELPELPATNLAYGCYSYMFSGCTSLTTAPELPATNLAPYCYNAMFYGCTSLTKAPELPATELVDFCYYRMFYGCTSLTKAPELPSTNLANSCYSYMFSGCTSLTKAPELPATNLAESCYSNMFNGCTSLTELPALPATTLARYCYYYMFSRCSSLTELPALPATTLTPFCYFGMFYNCSNIRISTTQDTTYSVPYRIPTTGTGTTESNALYNMFYNTGGKFTGTPDINTTYYVPAPAPATYTVTWKNWDGTELEKDENVAAGSTPSYDGENPTKPDDANNTYTFAGWTPEITAVTGDVTYTAQFTAVPKPHTHDGITFQPWTSTDTLPPNAGNYYLTSDVTLSGTWTVPGGTTNLCLNGHGIIRTGSGRVIDLRSKGRNLNIYDCDTVTEHRFTVNNPTENGAGVAVVNDALTENYQTFTGGYITGGNTNNGAGIHVYQATLKLYGGTVIGNSNTGDGGGIYVEKGGNLYIDGGTVSYNQARQGGGIYAPNIASFANIHLNSGRIEKNYATYTGGGVYGGNGVPVYLEGSIVVTGNYSLNAAGVTAAFNQSSARIYVSGSPYVYDNFNAKGQSNLSGALYENTMQITGNLGADCKVGLNAANGLLNYYKSDYTHTGIDPNVLFPYDNNNYILVKNGNNAKRIPLYTITFKNYDDEVLQTSKVISGETPEYNGATPTKEADAQYTYTFAGWTPEITPVTGEATYKATFTPNLRSYTITWLNDDDSVIDTTTVAYGDTPTHADATKAEDAQYTYTFAGWNNGTTTYAPNALPAVTGDATYTATFDAVAKNYFPFANLSLNGDIGVNFWIDTYGYDPEELRVNVSWYKYSNEYYFAGEDALPTREIGDKTYFIATANVAAKEMADTITVRLYKGDTELAAKTYSVRDYALTIINAKNPGAIDLALSEAKFAALKDLCKALLKYGSASEAQFDPQYPANIEAHTVDGIVISASDGVSYEDYNEAEIPAYTVPDYSGFAEGLTYYGSSIGTKTTTNYLIAFVGSNAPSVRYNGKTINPVAFGEGGVAYNINGIAAKNIPDDIVLTVNGNDVRFNMLAYITKALNVGDETLQSSVRALYDYGVKAKAYFNMAS